MTNTKKIVLSVIIVACIIAIYAIISKGEPITDTLKKAIQGSPDSKEDNSTLPAKGNPNREIKFNSRGTEVEYLQAYLNKKYSSNLIVDGIFGDITFGALKNNGYPFPISINQLTA